MWIIMIHLATAFVLKKKKKKKGKLFLKFSSICYCVAQAAASSSSKRAGLCGRICSYRKMLEYESDTHLLFIEETNK